MATSDPWALTGDLGEIVSQSLRPPSPPAGRRLSAGDVVITGSVVLPVDVSRGTWRVAADGLGNIAIEISRG